MHNSCAASSCNLFNRTPPDTNNSKEMRKGKKKNKDARDEDQREYIYIAFTRGDKWSALGIPRSAPYYRPRRVHIYRKRDRERKKHNEEIRILTALYAAGISVYT